MMFRPSDTSTLGASVITTALARATGHLLSAVRTPFTAGRRPWPFWVVLWSGLLGRPQPTSPCGILVHCNIDEGCRSWFHGVVPRPWIDASRFSGIRRPSSATPRSIRLMLGFRRSRGHTCEWKVKSVCIAKTGAFWVWSLSYAPSFHF